MTPIQKTPEALWQAFAADEHLSEQQLKLFMQYVQLLQEWNKKINLTRIIELPDIIAYHFQDSLRLADVVDLKKTKGICDVGSGGGFPGIPLKILFPHLQVILLEVNLKKVTFLNEAIKELGLEGIKAMPIDWRTFLRSTDYELDLVLVRASLKPDELIRMFKPNSFYNEAKLVYWGAKDWEPGPKELPFFVKKEAYTVGSKSRAFFLFGQKQAS